MKRINKIIVCFCFLLTLFAITSCSDDKEEYGYLFEENGFTPKGLYSARIAEKTYSGFKMAVITKAPEYGKENKYPIAKDTLVLYNSINGKEYKTGDNISFAISKCSLAKEKELCGRKFLWHAKIKEYKEKENQFVKENTVSIPQVQFIYVKPEGIYKGIVTDKKDTPNMGTTEINIRVTESPALAALKLWPGNDEIIHLMNYDDYNLDANITEGDIIEFEIIKAAIWESAFWLREFRAWEIHSFSDINIK